MYTIFEGFGLYDARVKGPSKQNIDEPTGRERVFFNSSGISRLFDLTVPTIVNLYGSRSNDFETGIDVNQLSHVMLRLEP